MTPGPTPAPPEVLAAIARPVIHHRGPDFKRLYAECLERLRQVFRPEREAAAVFFTHSETSTGVVSDPQPFAAAAREAGALSVIDAISSLGAVPLETDAWGLDVVASGAQKALMTPPGIALASVSPAAW